MNSSARTATIAAVAVVAVAFAACVVGLPLFLVAATARADCGGAAGGVVSQQPFDSWDGKQVANAAAIVGEGHRRKLPAWGYVIALAVAMQESRLYNLANDNPAYPEVVRLSMALPHEGVGDNFDSVGLFQQRPIEGDGAWGTVAELMTPATAASKFYNALVRVPGWEQMRLTDAAQAVQRSGFPEAYQPHEAAAQALVAHVLGLPDIGTIGGAGPHAPCGPGEFDLVDVGAGGWVQPLDMTRWSLVSGYRTSDRPDHDGVDIGGSADVRGAPIRAAAAGVIDSVGCQSNSGTCDRDGFIGNFGCGWYVEIRHPGDILTRYCHLLQRPYAQVGQGVPAGQVIGLVGSSGNSSGPHLHFEIHLNVPDGAYAGTANSTNPITFMAAAGAPLG